MTSNVAEEEADGKPDLLSRIRAGLGKTRARFVSGIGRAILGEKVIDENLLEEIETRLLTSDVGVEATRAIISSLTKKVARKELADGKALYNSLKEELAEVLRNSEQPLLVEPSKKPFVILMVGVNGAGNTTTVGKLARKCEKGGNRVMRGAAETDWAGAGGSARGAGRWRTASSTPPGSSSRARSGRGSGTRPASTSCPPTWPRPGRPS